MSVSQFKDFFECEAQAMAVLDGFDKFDNNTALLVGNYLHSKFESQEEHEKFIEENKESIMTKGGKLRADFVKAQEMIGKLENDDFFNFIYQGEKEAIFTGDLFGVEWKARIDLLNVEKGYFIDLKTTRELNRRYWSNKYGGYVTFVEMYDYVLQMAVYKFLLEQEHGKPFTPYIVAVSKETPVGIEALKFDESRFIFEYAFLEEALPRVIAVKNGEVEPIWCGKCKYCKQNKVLNGFIEIEELLSD